MICKVIRVGENLAENLDDSDKKPYFMIEIKSLDERLHERLHEVFSSYEVLSKNGECFILQTGDIIQYTTYKTYRKPPSIKILEGKDLISRKWKLWKCTG